jgi:site-specific DNA recombinase
MGATMADREKASSRRTRRLLCAIYTRKSSEEGLVQAFNSLDAQREACTAFILSQKHEGWTVLPTLYAESSQGHSGEVSRLLLRKRIRGTQVHRYGLPSVAIPHGHQSLPQEA